MTRLACSSGQNIISCARSPDPLDFGLGGQRRGARSRPRCAPRRSASGLGPAGGRRRCGCRIATSGNRPGGRSRPPRPGRQPPGAPLGADRDRQGRAPNLRAGTGHTPGGQGGPPGRSPAASPPGPRNGPSPSTPPPAPPGPLFRLRTRHDLTPSHCQHVPSTPTPHPRAGAEAFSPHRRSTPTPHPRAGAEAFSPHRRTGCPGS